MEPEVKEKPKTKISTTSNICSSYDDDCDKMSKEEWMKLTEECAKQCENEGIPEDVLREFVKSIIYLIILSMMIGQLMFIRMFIFTTLI